jgi:hypothetical protein
MATPRVDNGANTDQQVAPSPQPSKKPTYKVIKPRPYVSTTEDPAQVWAYFLFIYFYIHFFWCSEEHFIFSFVRYLGVTAGIKPATC